jgi:hypothetical protein
MVNYKTLYDYIMNGKKPTLNDNTYKNTVYFLLFLFILGKKS